MGPFIVETLRGVTRLPLDVHLMVDNPDVMIPWYASAGATRISVQIETCPHIYRTLQFIRSHNCIPGVVLNPGTPASAIQEVLGLAELVLVMTVNPGFSGQTFIPEVLPKITQVKKMIERAGCPVLIQVDGGINPANLQQTYQAGARVFVSATSIFSHPQGISAGIQELRKAVP
jgi:ribulose-phosphate 3-epimerase